MTTYKYKAPLNKMRFIINEVLDAPNVLGGIEKFKTAGFEIGNINLTLKTGAEFTEKYMAPFNNSGDREGCTEITVGEKGKDQKIVGVKTPQGFQKAADKFREDGLGAVSCDPEYGGAGLPNLLNTAVGEMMCSANLALSMYFGLTRGQIDALQEYGSAEVKETYLPKLISCEWMGTMCITEPQAGSDVGKLTTTAKKDADGQWLVDGTKIFISAGDHDLASNISHFVIARTDPNSKGTKGLSVFVVPKYLPDEKGEPGEANSLHVGHLEHKMGIRGNSNCEMKFENAKGFLVGKEGEGMKVMWAMMNAARLGVGVQGVGLSELALQEALHYASQERKQSGDPSKIPLTGEPVYIIEHALVSDMIMTMESESQGARMLESWTAQQLDLSQSHPDPAEREKAKGLLNYLTPILKAHATDNALKHAEMCVQTFGGTGFMEETGVAQIVRDAVIPRIYEGTNEIQAMDFMFRKTLQQGLAPGYIEQVKADLATARTNGLEAGIVEPVEKALQEFEKISGDLRMRAGMAKYAMDGASDADKPAAEAAMSAEVKDSAARARDFLHLASIVTMGQMWVKMSDSAQRSLAESSENKEFYETTLGTARYYMEKILVPEAQAKVSRLATGAKSLSVVANDNFAQKNGNVGLKARPAPAPKP